MQGALTSQLRGQEVVSNMSEPYYLKIEEYSLTVCHKCLLVQAELIQAESGSALTFTDAMNDFQSWNTSKFPSRHIENEQSLGMSMFSAAGQLQPSIAVPDPCKRQQTWRTGLS